MSELALRNSKSFGAISVFDLKRNTLPTGIGEPMKAS